MRKRNLFHDARRSAILEGLRTQDEQTTRRAHAAGAFSSRGALTDRFAGRLAWRARGEGGNIEQSGAGSRVLLFARSDLSRHGIVVLKGVRTQAPSSVLATTGQQAKEDPSLRVDNRPCLT